jgi:1-acyl-sn-glycerol-3-phosphate acyltransferase
MIPAPDSNRFYDFMKALIVAFNKVYFRLQHFGAGNTPLNGPVLLVANHASNLDPTTIACGLPRQVHFLAKDEIFRGLFGAFLRKVNAHPINRSGVDRAALKRCVDLVREGHMLLMFPEGTRTRDGQLLPAKPGAAMIATQAEAMILPVYISGTLHAMPKGAKFIHPVKVRVFVGKPFAYNDGIDASLPRREQYDLLGNKMMEHIAELKKQADRK